MNQFLPLRTGWTGLFAESQAGHGLLSPATRHRLGGPVGEGEDAGAEAAAAAHHWRFFQHV